MNIKYQVVSLNIAKKLLTLGVKQNSLFYWVASPNPKVKVYSVGMSGNFNKNYHENDMISAFTASEIMQILPDRIDTGSNEPFNHFRFNMQRSIVVEEFVAKRSFIINYPCDTYSINDVPMCTLNLIKHNIWDYSLPDALAKTLIYLIEEGLVNCTLTTG